MLDNAPPSRRRKGNAASVRECPEQWGIPKLAGGKEPTGLFARKRLLAPYTGEAILRRAWQDTVSAAQGKRRARLGNGAHNAPFPSSQMVNATPRRGKAVWSAARFVCRMTLYACRSSSRKTRHAIFAGALKAKKAFARPRRGGYNKVMLCGDGVTRRQGNRIYSLSHDTEGNFGCRDSSLKKAPKIRGLPQSRCARHPLARRKISLHFFGKRV